MVSNVDTEKEATGVETSASTVSPSTNGWQLDRTAKTWLEQTKSESNLTTRKRVLSFWVQAMGFKSAEEGAALFRLRKIDPTTSGNKLVALLEKEGKAPASIFLWRNVLGTFFRYLVPDMPKGLYNPKQVDLIPLTEKVGLERDEIKTLLEKANPKYRAAISVLLSTGCRIGELVSIRVKKLNFSKSPARVGFIAQDTKTKKARQSFLSSETVDLIQDWLKSRDYPESEYLFPSPDDPTQRQTVDTTRTAIYEVFASAGLLKKEGKMHVLHPHSFRGINLALTKATGFPEDWAETLAGHKRGVEATYEIPEETAKLWAEKVEPKFCFLGRASAVEVRSLEQAIDARAKEAEDLKTRIEGEVSKLRKQMEGKNPTSSPTEVKWQNTQFDYWQVQVGSPEYRQVLTEHGWELFDKDEKTRVFRKPKPETQV